MTEEEYDCLVRVARSEPEDLAMILTNHADRQKLKSWSTTARKVLEILKGNEVDGSVANAWHAVVVREAAAAEGESTVAGDAERREADVSRVVASRNAD